MKSKLSTLFLVIICLVGLSAPLAANENQAADAAQIEPEVIEQIAVIIDEISSLKTEIARLDKSLAATKLEAEIESLAAQRQNVLEQLKKQQNALEQIATGAVDLSLFRKAPVNDFNWQTEVKEILRPILFELKKLTEKPRQIESLRSRETSLQTRIEAATIAIEEIGILIAAVEVEDTKKALAPLLTSWQERREDLERELNLVRFQLNEKLDNSEAKGTVIARALKEFFTGHGLNLFLAIIAFIITFAVLRYSSHLVKRWIKRGQDAESRLFSRLAHVIFQVFTVVAATFALLATLYTLGDWLILTLLLIFLVAVAFTLRNSLPRYVDEVRLLLNIGPAREGERVIYNGLPWRISRLNIYSVLINPVLTGGRLRLPMRVMNTLISRRWSREEPWFPTKAGDYLILADDTFGKVAMQTPEFVQLKLFGGAIKTYPTLDFLAQTPRNLSGGFSLFVTFGLDYSLQEKITTDVLTAMQRNIRQAVETSRYGEHLGELRVEFKEAGASSLDLMIIAAFDGAAAADYIPLERFIQRAAVDACNKNAWTIPFTQLTVHMQPDDYTQNSSPATAEASDQPAQPKSGH
ncbi:hypothetical protein FKG94_12330 [Exilibacterium tricleocarpae]|uniref:Mechanosensitive ion channel n=1 Tax=Exilibacterium tricleocarpae TaxID=2591008 RepID=A0A545TNK6_9GAMM|nr:mechanosensitive ion channel family protein [Exilibacterium tricleocarpae]TQV78802.1 hypothetical protein FKG94_12330 [Exilibacterium tricleocarpae]